jgi:hypothetical protein
MDGWMDGWMDVIVLKRRPCVAYTTCSCNCARVDVMCTNRHTDTNSNIWIHIGLVTYPIG